MDDCLLCKLIKAEIPVYKIYEDDKFVAVLDAFPHIPGQTVVIFKEHIPSNFSSAPSEALSEIVVLGQKIAQAIEKALKMDRTVQITEGMHVDHFHIKLFPVPDEKNYSVANLEAKYPSPKELITPEEGNRVRDLIKAELK